MKSLPSKILLVLVTVLLVLSLCACEKREDDYKTDYSIAIDRLEYDADTATVVVRIILDENGRVLSGATAKRTYTLQSKNSWWNEIKNDYVLDGSAIYGAVGSALTQDELNRDGVVYSHLKIVFDYATIYKSTKSAGSVTKSGKEYVHSFDVAADGNTAVTFTRETPYTAVWYATLICAGLIFAVLVAVISSAARGKYARLRKEN